MQLTADNPILERYQRASNALVHPLWLTARTRYTEVPLPPAFRVETVELSGARRRIARAEGAGPPLVIVPGLYASLNESLFVEVAERARRLGRRVTLVEDRFASGTLALNGVQAPHVSTLGTELGELLRASGDEDAELLAFSAGAASALFVDTRPRRIVAWSAAFDPAQVLAWTHRHLVVRFYFGHVHAQAYRRAKLQPPRWEDFVLALGHADVSKLTRAPLQIIHAEDDPVAPVSAVRGLPLREGQTLTVLPHGAHLGFGTLLGTDVYLMPL